MKTRTIGAGEFKQGCLALLDEVAETHQPIVITKRGRPVARLVPIEDPAVIEQRALARMRAMGRVLASDAELMAPLEADWELDAANVGEGRG